MLTIEQKIEAYKWVREGVSSSGLMPVCTELMLWLCDNKFYELTAKQAFPEWWKKKPNGVDVLLKWWPSFSPLRLQALDEVIEELEEKLKNEKL